MTSFGQELMTHVESFQCEAQKVIQSSGNEVKRLQHLLDTGNSLDVDLPEIPKLKQVGLYLHIIFEGNFCQPSQV